MKKVNCFAILLFSFCATILLNAQKAPTWSVDLGEPIKTNDFMQDGKLLFFTSGEYAWCYNSATGTQVWHMEVPDFDDHGISYLLGEMYLTNSDNKLQAYDATTGKLLWEKEYEDVDQSDYVDFEFIKNNAVFRYGQTHLGVDLNNGNELYRYEVHYWSDLVDWGTFNYSVFENQGKMLVMEDSEIASLFDIRNGDKLLSLEDYDVNEDLIKNGFPWLYKSPDRSHLLFVLDDGAAVIDVVNNKEMVRKEFDIDGDMNAILPTKVGCAVMGEEKFVHFNFETGEVNELEFPIDDIRTMYSYETEGKTILLVSMGDRMASVDLQAGKVLWETEEDDPMFEGYAHRYLQVDGENVILVYNRARLVSSDAGTYLYLMSINGITGKVNYKTPALLSGAVWTNFQRGLTKILTTAFTAFIGTTSMGNAPTDQATDMVNKMLGYDNIGFDYQTIEHNGNIIFFSRSDKTMMNPENRETPGEGFVSIDPKTGKVKYRNYFEIADGINANELEQLSPIYIDGDNAYVAGDEKIIKFDLASGKKLWENDNETGQITDILLYKDALNTKFGKKTYYINLVEKEVQVKGALDIDPYGFQAYDPATGKSLWKVSIDNDPSLLTPQFSIKNYLNTSNDNLYFADEENLYALKVGKDGGQYSWKYNFDQNGIGEIDYEDSYAVKERRIGSPVRKHSFSSYVGGYWVTSSFTSGGIEKEKEAKFLEDAAESDLSTTYETFGSIWGVSAKRCLRVLFGSDVLLVVGPDAIGMVNANTGNSNWVSPWDYDNEEVQFIPKIIGNSIIYCSQEDLAQINLLTGSKDWEAEESDKSKFFESPKEKYFFSVNDEDIKGYTISK
jgi:outer membrane protein assembly factor BamB